VGTTTDSQLRATRLNALAIVVAALIAAAGALGAAWITTRDDEAPTTPARVVPLTERPSSTSELHNRHVAAIEIDGELYVRILELLESIESGPVGSASAGEALEEVLDDQGGTDSDERLFVESSLQALLGHADGRYRGGENAIAAERVPELLRLLWTFHRAWVDRYGFVHAMHATPARPSIEP